MRLAAITRLAIAAAGNTVVHQIPALMLRKASLTCAPQSGDGGCGPAPRNDSVATVNTAYPMHTVSSTMIGPLQFGRISLNITNVEPSPRSFADVT